MQCKLLDQNNTYHHSIGKTSINADYSALTEKNEINPKAPKIKVNDRFRIKKYEKLLVKVTLEIGQEKFLLLILWWRLIFGLIKLMILTDKK